MTVDSLEPQDTDVVVATATGATWARLREEWLASRRSPKTESAYRLDVTQWEAFCGTSDPLAARRMAAASWARHMEAQGLSPATIARKLASLSSLYRHIIRAAQDEGYGPPSNPFDIDRPVVDKHHSDTIALDEKQGRAMIAAAERDGLRSQVIVEILLTTGIRSAELLGTQISDLRLDHGVPTITVTRKGGKRARLPMQPQVWETIREYVGDRTDGPLIVTSSGRPMVHKNLYRLIRRLARAADLGDGVAERFSPHGLRASFATINFDDGTPLSDIQDYMGHVDPGTTRRYDRGKGRLARLSRASAVVARHVLRDRGEAPA